MQTHTGTQMILNNRVLESKIWTVGEAREKGVMYVFSWGPFK